MKARTKSGSKISPSWPTRPFFPFVSCLSHYASSTRRPRRRVRETSPPFPQWPPQCPPSTRMPSQPFPSAVCVATAIPPLNAWLRAKSATTEVAGIIALPCVDETKNHISPPKTAEPNHPDNQADHARENRSRCNQSSHLSWNALHQFLEPKPFPQPFLLPFQ